MYFRECVLVCVSVCAHVKARASHLHERFQGEVTVANQILIEHDFTRLYEGV